MLLLIKIQNFPQRKKKTSNLYKVDYKIQDTDGFNKIRMSLSHCLSWDFLRSRMLFEAREPHSNKTIQGTTVACFPFQ